jgi:hypothetical protein
MRISARDLYLDYLQALQIFLSWIAFMLRWRIDSHGVCYALSHLSFGRLELTIEVRRRSPIEDTKEARRTLSFV